MKLSLIQKVQVALSAVTYRKELKQLLIRRYWQRNKTFEIKANDVTARFDTSDFLSNILFWHGEHYGGFTWEPTVCELLSILIKKSSVYADVGGNAGVYSILPALLNPSCKVFYFELDSTLKSLVRRHMRLNNLDDSRITIVNGAVGNGNEPVEYEPHLFSFLGKFTNEDIWRYDMTLRAQPIILDQYFRDHGADPDLLKIDVDGYETAVLRGMSRILGETKPHLLLEVHPELIKRYGSTAAEACAILKSHGYRFFRIADFRLNSSSQIDEIFDFSNLGLNEMVVVSHRSKSVF